jgi:release factor glutamine methyltransferase
MRQLRAEILAILSGVAGSKSPLAETERILLHVLSSTRPELDSLGKLYLLDPEPTWVERGQAIDLARARATGIPLQHLFGYQTFLDRDYEVNDSTLIPRPETEVLVTACVEWITNRAAGTSLRFGELGLGSGVISCEILARFPRVSGVASEASSAAIELAKSNLARWCGPDWQSRLEVLAAPPESGFGILEPHGPFDLVISNPPYVSREDDIEFEVLTHEPESALFPWNHDPDFFYSDFISRAADLMAPGGVAFFEIPHERASRLEAEFQRSGANRIVILPDLTGRPRVLRAEF